MIQTSKYKKILMLFLALYPFVSFAQLTTITFSGTGVLTANSWTTHSGTTGQITTIATTSDAGNSLSYSGLPTSTNNRTTTIAGNSEDVNYAVSTIANAGSVYYSALIKLPNITGQAANTTTGNYFMTLTDTNGAVVTTGFVGRLYVRAGATANTFNLGVLNNSGGTALAANIYGATPVDYAINTTYLVVVKYTYATNTASLWINPTVSATEPTALFTTNFGTGAAPTKSKGIVIRQAGIATAGTGNIEIDEIRVSNNWSDVLGLSSSSANYSLALDGINDFGSIANSFFTDINQRNFTIEFYLKADPSQTQYPGIWGKTGNWIEINLHLWTPAKIALMYATSIGGLQYFNSDTISWQANHWDHYAIVGDASANQLRTYKNGVLDAITTHGTPNWSLPNNDSKIGAVFNGFTTPNIQYFKGKIDDFRVSDVARYNSNFTPPQNLISDINTRVLYNFNSLNNNIVTDLSGNNNNLTLQNGASLDTDAPYMITPVLPSYVPTTGLVGYWPFSGNANDASGNGYNLTNYNVTYDIDKSQNTNACAYFSGNASYLKSQTAFSQITSSPKQSYSFWFKNVQSNWRYIVNYASSATTRISIVPNTLASTKSIGLIGENGCYNCNGSSGSATINTPGLDIGWHHVVVSVDINNYSVYYDGSLLTTQTHSGFNCVDSAFRFVLGNDVVCSPEYYNMYLDDIGVWNRSLTQSEVTALYNQAPNPVLPSNIPTSGLLAYYPFNGNANDLSGNAYNLTQVGTNVISKNDRFNNLNSSYYFGGTNPENKFNFPTSFYPAYNSLNSGSISFWMNIDSIVDHSHYFGFDNTFFVKQKNGQNSESYIGLSNGKIRFHMTGALPASNMQVDVKQLVTKKWYNLTVSWTPSNLYIYIDGLLSSSFSGNFGLSNTPSPDFISIGGFYGTGGTGCYSSIDDFGIWNRALTQSEITALSNMPNTSTNDTLSIVNTQSDTLIFPNKIKVSLKSNDLSAKNIISYEIKLSYDQTKLIFDSVSLNNTASANGLIVTNNNTTGLLKLVWARSTKLTGTLPLLNCFFSPIDSGKSKINIIYALFNTDTVRNLKSKTLINKYNFGDIDLNSFIQAYDGMVALRYSVGMDPIPLIDPLPWENWRVKVASVDSSAIVTANDASLILKYVVGLINQFPKRGLNYSNGYVLTSIENNEIVFRSFGNLQGLNVSFLNQFDKLNPASFIFSNDAISAVNILDNIYKVGIAFNNSPEPGSIILKIPISGELKNDLNIELYENENKRLINLNKSTSITSESKTNHLIFPNPTTNLVNIIGLGKTETEVSIYDIQGKLILSRKIIDQGIIDMSDLYNGVYLLKIGEVVHRVTKL